MRFSSTRTSSTFDISVKSIHLHDTRQVCKIYCRRRTWMGVPRRSVACFFSSCGTQWSESLHRVVIVTHQQRLCQEKRHCQENHPDHSCYYDFKYFLTVPYLRRRAPPPLWGPGPIPNNWADVCGFLKPPCSQRFWKVNKHCAFAIPRQALGLRSSDQSCHHETWLHLHFVDWNNKWGSSSSLQREHSPQGTASELWK